jgi:hypothetical protein
VPTEGAASDQVFDATLRNRSGHCLSQGRRQLVPSVGPDTSVLLDLSQLIIPPVYTQKAFVK